MRRHDLYHDTQRLRIARIELEPGAGISAHCHSTATEWLQCEQGTLQLRLGHAGARTIVLQAGAHHCINPAQVHALANVGDTVAIFLLVQSGRHDFVQTDGG